MPNVAVEDGFGRRGHRGGIALGIGLLMAWSVSGADRFYEDGPRATDADRIATEMLNDVVSGRFRQMDYRLPPNPFTQKIEEYQNRQRARAAEMAWYAENAQRLRAEREQEERESAAERERYERQQREWARFDTLQRAAMTLDPEAHLRLGMLIDSGKYDPNTIQFRDNLTPRAYALQRYDQAIGLGMDLAIVATVCAARDLKPGFPVLWESVRALPSPLERRDYLERFARDGHTGARLLLGGWAAGRNVGLQGVPPVPEGESPRSYALRWLDRVSPEALRVWYAETLLSGRPTDAEKAQAVGILEKVTQATDNGTANAFVALAHHLLSQAATPAEFERPRSLLRTFERLDYVPGFHALVGMYMGGTDGEFHPGRAARVYARLPETTHMMADRARGLLFDGIDQVFGVDSVRSPADAVSKFEEADLVLDKAAGGRNSITGLRRELRLWRAYALAEAGKTRLLVPDPVGALYKENEDYGGIAKLLWRHAFLGVKTNSDLTVSGTWSLVRNDKPLDRNLTPIEVLLYLQTALRAYERGVAPGLQPYAEEIRQLKPSEAPTRGAALLAKLFLTPVFRRDVAKREALVPAYGSLVRAAWRQPQLWGDVAALVEVLQTEPLSQAQWRSGWLRPFFDTRAAQDSLQRQWGQWMLEPSAGLWSKVAGDGGLALRSLQSVRPEFQALRASVILRTTSNTEAAGDAFRALMELAQSGQWHAQSIVESFAERFRLAYALRSDLAGFRAHARAAAEATATWRKEGHGFSFRDKDARLKAIGQALEFGSTNFQRSLLLEAESYSSAAAVALMRLRALDADERTQVERQDDQLIEARWSRFCDKKGIPVDQGSTLYRMDSIASEIASEQGAEAALGFMQRQARRYPALLWSMGAGFSQGSTFYPHDPARALEAFRRAAASATKPRFADLIRWGKTVAALGNAEDFRQFEARINSDGYGLERWQNPNEKGYSMALEPPLDTVELLAAAVLERDLPRPGTSRVEALERARWWQLFALRLGSLKAVERLRRSPFSILPDAGATLARALIEASTLNVPLALNVLTNDVPEGPLREALVRPWIDSAGNPSPRYERILQWHHKNAGDRAIVKLDPQRYAFLQSKPEWGWLPWETSQLVDAYRNGDGEARRILLESQLLPASAIGLTPDAWIQQVREALDKRDREALRRFAVDAKAAWAAARYYWVAGSADWRRAARTLGDLGVRFHGELSAEGIPEETVHALLEIGLQGGHGPAFKALANPAKNPGTPAEVEARVLGLAARVLDFDMSNAAFLEAVALPRIQNRARWNELFQARMLYADDKGTPTSVLEFSRANVARETARGVLLERGSIEASFFPKQALYRHGYTGYLLLNRAAQDNDPLAIRALATLGYARGDWSEIMNP